MKDVGRFRRALYSSGTSALSEVVGIVCSFIASKAIIQAYGSSWNGVVASISEFLSWFYIVNVGINGATRVALYKSLAENDDKKTSSIIKANDIYYRKVSLILVLYIAFIAVWIPNIIQADFDNKLISLMTVILGVGMLIQNCWGINSQILLGSAQRKYIINIAEIVAKVANVILLLIIINLGGSVFVSKAGSVSVNALVPIALFIISRRLFNIDKHAKPDNTALKGRWDVLANSLSNMVHSSVDTVFLTIFCPAAELSVYSLYLLVANGLRKTFEVITNGIEAGFGDMWVKGEFNLLKDSLRKFEYIMYTLAVLLFGCMIVLIVPFMSLYMTGVTDANYMRFPVGLVLAIANIWWCIRTPYVLLVQAAGHYRQVKVGAFMEAGINIALTWLLVARYGIVGAVIGTIVANAFRTVQYGWYASKHMIDRSFSVVVWRIIWAAVALASSVLISLYFVNMLTFDGWLTWLVAGVITFVIHFIILLVMSIIFYKEDLKGTTRLIKRIFHK